MSRLVEPLNWKELVTKGTVFQVDAKSVYDAQVENHNAHEADENLDDINKFINLDCVQINDEDNYETGGPFQTIAKNMVNLTNDGKIKKRILRQGAGECPTGLSTVTVHYNAYMEYNEEPFDSTYVRKKPRQFVLNDGRVIPGLDFAIQSMKVQEKSQFLIAPEYAYGKLGIQGTIPANSEILFEVELIQIIDTATITTYEKLDENAQTSFSETYAYCLALSDKGKQKFLIHDLKSAIIDYNSAICKLEKSMFVLEEDSKTYHEMLLKLYTNLLICYTRNNQHHKGCKVAKKIYQISDHGDLLKLPAKVYFNHAKCLRILHEYDEAKSMLDKAFKIEPKNSEIANELFTLQKYIKEQKQTDLLMAKGLVGNTN